MNTAEFDYPAIAHEIKRSSTRSRNLDIYLDCFHLKKNELRGKTFLDIGASLSTFGQEAERLGARVVELDARKNPRKRVWGQTRAIAQQLPFREGSFDYVLNSYCDMWVATGRIEIYSEMLRVVKDGGMVMVHPIAVKNPHLRENVGSVRLLLDEEKPATPWVTMQVVKQKGIDVLATAKSMDEVARSSGGSVLAPLLDDLTALTTQTVLRQQRFLK